MRRLLIRLLKPLIYHPVLRPRLVRFLEGRFDRKYGVDTAGSMEIHEGTTHTPNAAHGTRYQATSPRLFAEMMSKLPIDHKDFTFIDVGCGKGRALFMASEFPFHAITGVEFVAELAAIAQQNIAHFDASNITAVCGDATTFSFPDANLVLYFFNPFDAVIMQQVLDNVGRWFALTGRKAYLVYCRPECEPLLARTPFLKLVARNPEKANSYCVYETR